MSIASPSSVSRQSTYGSIGIAVYRYKSALARLGEDHPQTRASWGRLAALRGHVPQRNATSPEAVAWWRESGTIPGYLNRAHRRSYDR